MKWYGVTEVRRTLTGLWDFSSDPGSLRNSGMSPYPSLGLAVAAFSLVAR